MEDAVKNALKLTIDVVNQYLTLTDRDSIDEALTLAEQAKVDILQTCYDAEKQNYHENGEYGNDSYYESVMSLTMCLENIVSIHEERLRDAFYRPNRAWEVEEDERLAKKFTELWVDWKVESANFALRNKPKLVSDIVYEEEEDDGYYPIV